MAPSNASACRHQESELWTSTGTVSWIGRHGKRYQARRNPWEGVRLGSLYAYRQRRRKQRRYRQKGTIAARKNLIAAHRNFAGYFALR
jgi:hypothetical protein